MRGIPSSFLVVFFALVFLAELVSYFGFRMLINLSSKKIRTYFTVFYLLVSITTTGLLLFSFSNPELIRQSRNYDFFLFVISVSFLNLFPKTVFTLLTFLSFVIRWFTNRRGQMIALSGSFLLVSGLFLVITYGIVVGKNDLKVEKHMLYFENLPKQLDGLKIVQLSDIHLGSLGNDPGLLVETRKILNSIQPDLLLFTGDIVNNFATEMDGFIPYLEQLSAKYGKFAIQGNHDYGDYSQWPDTVSKKLNLSQIRDGLSRAGFQLLLNRWKVVSIKDTSICIIGVENWGHAPFPQYASLTKAMEDIPANSFKILLTHDPAHWNAKIIPETDIPLSLSGHTHGGQFGIKWAGIEFSPIYFIQKNWGGLYKSDNQLLYVNRGLGTIGFPGRIDMRPEITLLILHLSKNH